MNHMYLPEEREVMEATRYFPSVSVIVPVPSKSSGVDFHKELQRLLKEATARLLKEYPDEQALPVIKKLQGQLQGVDYATYKKSMAVYASPLLEKTLYLDIPVEEKLVIGESFEIRDIVQNQTDGVDYILFVLSANCSKAYLGSMSSELKLLVKEDNHHIIGESEHERVGNFSDHSAKKETAVHKFFQDADAKLSLLIRSYHLPVLFMAPPKVLGAFKQMSQNVRSISAFIAGGHEESSVSQLRRTIEPYLEKWKEIKEHYLLNVLDHAISCDKAVAGIEHVWNATAHKNCRILLVESGYRCKAIHSDKPDMIEVVGASESNLRAIEDVVNEVIERVLQNGGDVEFMHGEALKSYGHIALVKYY